MKPDALIKYDLGLRDVVEALERNNANAAAGFIVRGWEQTYIRGLGQIKGVDDIREVVLKVDGQEVARTTVKMTVPGAFSASEPFDVGVDLGSTVSLDYFDRRPFRFDGKVQKVSVELK